MWPTVSFGDDKTIGPFLIDTCLPVPGKVKASIARCRSPWLLFGRGLDDTVLTQIWRSAATMRPSARLAMLGAPNDLKRCDRWLHRGCSVYVSESIRAEDLNEILTLAAMLGVTVIGRDFVDPHWVNSMVSLSGRESDVLGLLCEGLRNSEIAEALSLTENTIEFHVRRLLLTLGARNRVQAAAFGIQKGLV
jgi:DNA-binding NarL/FixJ family response regulator